jgi:hypothetical protein
MPKMKFNTCIKYKDAYHKGLEPFEVDESDVAEMQKYGGVIISESKSKAKPKPDREDKPEDEDKVEDKPEDSRKRGKKKAAGDS